MRFGLDVAQQRMPWDELVRRVQLAEELGFDGAWGFDHFQPMYGEGPGETFEGMTTLAALAGVTSRIRLGLLVTGVTYRHPSVLAAQALTIDHASHGRLELSLGAAWFDKEHHELGIPFPSTSERFDLLEDALEIVTRLSTGDVVSYDGHVVSLKDAQLRPPPVQQPHPPIWIGGTGPRRTLPLVARYADVWHAFGTPGSLTEAYQRVDQLAVEAGRDPVGHPAGRVAVARRPRHRPQARRQVARCRATATWCAVGPRRATPRWSSSRARSWPTSPIDRLLGRTRLPSRGGVVHPGGVDQKVAEDGSRRTASSTAWAATRSASTAAGSAGCSPKPVSASASARSGRTSAASRATVDRS